MPRSHWESRHRYDWERGRGADPWRGADPFLRDYGRRLEGGGHWYDRDTRRGLRPTPNPGHGGYDAPFRRGYFQERMRHTGWAAVREEPGFDDVYAIDDRDLERAVRWNIGADYWVDSERIDVSVHDGVVTLSGEVDDYMEARYAWDDAWDTPGVRGVISKLDVRMEQEVVAMAEDEDAAEDEVRE